MRNLVLDSQEILVLNSRPLEEQKTFMPHAKAYQICRQLEKDEIEINPNPLDRWHYMTEQHEAGTTIMCCEIVQVDGENQLAFIGYL